MAPTYDEKQIFVQMRQAAESLLRTGVSGDDFLSGLLDAQDSLDVAGIHLMNACLTHKKAGYMLLVVSKSTTDEAVGALVRYPRNQMQDWVLVRGKS